MNVACVHDWLTTYVGSERVVESVLELFPDAPLYTLVYRPEQFANTIFATREIHTSFIERLPGGREKYRRYLALMPLAIEQFDLGAYDVVISSCHAVAKGVLTRADQLHISYIHTPIRYAWDLQFQYLREAKLERGLKSWVARAVLHYIRQWDVLAANRVDVFVANSHYVASRIRKTYRRDAQVIYPPVDVERFAARAQRDDFYLAVSRFVPYKKLDLIVEAFTRLGRPLVVIGEGPDDEKIRREAGGNVQFLGWQPVEGVKGYMERCKAFMFAADEDFGIAPVEAQAAGAPVIAYSRGGVTETVIPDETGLFFHEQNVESLMEAVRRFEADPRRFDPQRIRANAERFSKARFKSEFQALVDREWAKFGR